MAQYDDTHRVSVVIPAFRAGKTISRSLESVRSQERLNVEIIVVVDGVYDDTPNIAARYANTVLLNDENRGAPYSRNRGLSFVSTPYVMFLDADDYLDGPLLSGLLARMIEKDSVMGIGRCWYEFESGERIRPKLPDVSSASQFVRDWFDHKIVPPCSMMWNTEFIRNIGGWNESIVRNQDGELVMRAIARGARPVVSWSGSGVYYHHTMPHRINMMAAETKYGGSYHALNVIEDELRHSDVWCEEMQAGIAFGYYDLARYCFREGVVNVGRNAIKQARALGFKFHCGSVSHRFWATLLGLEWKERIKMLLRS